MSTGHLRGAKLGERELDQVLDNQQVKRRLARPYRVDRSHDIPYLGGYSEDGRTIYVDRHLPSTIKVGKRDVGMVAYLLLHERIEKAVLDALGYSYAHAHEIATAAEHRLERARGLVPSECEKALKPYIKGAEIERIVRPPRDLDLTPYKAEPVDQALLAHLEKQSRDEAPKKKHTKAEANYSRGKMASHCAICRYFHPGESKTALGTCDRVRGAIGPQMWCKFFDAESGTKSGAS